MRPIGNGQVEVAVHQGRVGGESFFERVDGHFVLACDETQQSLVSERLRISRREVQHPCGLGRDGLPVPAGGVEAGEREARVDLVGVPRERGLDLRLFAFGGFARAAAAADRHLARDGAAGLARLCRLNDEEADEQQGRDAAGAPEVSAHARAARGRRRVRRHAALVERKQDPGGVELKGIALARELFGRALAGRVLHLPELTQERVALALQVSHLHGNARTGPRRMARSREHTPDEHSTEDEAHREDGEGREPVEAGRRVHDAAAGVFGGTPSGQP